MKARALLAAVGFAAMATMIHTPVAAGSFPVAQGLEAQPELLCVIVSVDPNHPCGSGNSPAGVGNWAEEVPEECKCSLSDLGIWLDADIWLDYRSIISANAADPGPIDPVFPLPAPLPF